MIVSECTSESVSKTIDVSFVSNYPNENAPVGMVTEECGQWEGQDNDWNSWEEEISRERKTDSQLLLGTRREMEGRGKGRKARREMWSGR